jgi:murein DD-endopeptidase MepM/ murein hydrolase activator NlpD
MFKKLRGEIQMKRFIYVLLAIMLAFSNTVSLALTKEEELQNTKDKISKTQSELKQNEAEQKSVRKEINNLDLSINNTQEQITTTKTDIATVEQNIEKKKEEIAEAQAEYDAKYELRKNRMVAYYKNGTISLEEQVSKIESEPDKMYMESAIARVVDYDTNLINEIEEARIALEKKKAEFEDENLRLAELKSYLEVKLASLNETLELRSAYLKELEDDHAELEKAEDEMKEQADKLTQEIREAQAAAQRANQTSSTYVGGKMTWPLPGHYTITSPFGMRFHPVLKQNRLHTGVDIAGYNCNGSKVVAAADGVVIVSKYNTAYGNYIVIDHGGGITTLYAHSSRLVAKVGDKVKAGQEIMKVGTTGYSTGPHLHFEVRENGNYVNPLNGYIRVP